MEKTVKSMTTSIAHGSPSDEALLEIIQSNVQRLPSNDNPLTATTHVVRSSLIGRISSSIAVGGIMLVGVLLMTVFRLVPPSKDSHY